MEKPANANEECVGVDSAAAGKASSCEGCPSQALCASGAIKAQMEEQKQKDLRIGKTLQSIGRTILVLSGKGGVGKSTCSAQLAFSLAAKGYKVGLLDVDICGPSIPLMLGLQGREVHQSASGWSPVYVTFPSNDPDVESDDAECELAVMSIGFLVPDQDSAIIWRGPKKNGLIEQFFTTVDWGEIDYLIIDTPPGTSDEHISLVQLLTKHLDPTKGDGAVIVSTPQEVAMMDVRKEINFCKTTKLNVLGVIENMGKSIVNLKDLIFLKNDNRDATQQMLKLLTEKCPEALDFNVEIDMFPEANGGVPAMAARFNLPFLGKIPLDKTIQTAGDTGKAISDPKILQYWNPVVDKIVGRYEPKVGKSTSIKLNGSGVINV